MMFLDSIARESQKVQTLTTDVLNYSRGLTQKLSEVSLICSACGVVGGVLVGKTCGVGKLLQDKL